MKTRSDKALALALGLITLALYIKTLAPTVLMADGGEFQFVPYLLGIAHPTGYPLFLLLGKLFSLIPLGDVAYRANLMSAFFGAVTVGLLYLVIGQVLHRAASDVPFQRAIAALSALTFALSSTFWSQAVIAEVYTLNALFVAFLLYLLLSFPLVPLSAIALLYGLSLTHHRTMILLFPPFVLFICSVDRRLFTQARPLLKGAIFLLMPLLLYLYIPLRAPQTPYLHIPLSPGRELVLYENTLRGFLDFVLGRVFAAQLGYPIQGLARIRMALDLLVRQSTPPGVVLGLVGLIALFASKRWKLLILLLLSYLSLVLFNLFYFIGDIKVLFIPSYLIYAIWIGVGVAAIAKWVRDRGFSRPLSHILCLAPLAFLALLPLNLLTANYGRVDKSGDYTARRRWEEILSEPIPEGAILVSNDRNEVMPMWYLQYVEGVRPDLIGLFPLITQDPEHANVGRLVDSVLDVGRPIYLIKEMPGLEIKYELEPFHSLVEVVAPAIEGEPQHPCQIALADEVLLVGYDREPRSPQPGQKMRLVLYWQASKEMDQAYSSFVHLLDAEGRLVAQSDHRPGGVYYPTDLWQVGETLRDEHAIAIPPNTPPGAYHLRAGMYLYPAMQPLGENISLGKVGVKREVQTSPGEIEHPWQVNLGDKITFLGYDLARSGGELHLTLHWQARRTMERDYTVFVHLTNGKGQIVAQQDNQPQGGAYPTSIWDEGEVVKDEYALPLYPDLPPGEYQLRVGMYLLETLERLPLLDENGQTIGDNIVLEEISLK